MSNQQEETKVEIKLTIGEQRGRNLYKQYGPICTSEGFYQHSGQCWSDALQMLMLYTDGIKEFTQEKLATQDVEFKEIETKFELIIHEKLKSINISLENPQYNELKMKNLRAIFLYFKAVQERFHRHYMAEIERYEKFGPVKCYSFEKIGQESLETLKEIAISYRSPNVGIEKSGIRSAIMGKSEKEYLIANREEIGKTFKYGKRNKSTYETGGSNEEIEFLLELYSIYFDIQLNFKYELKINNRLDIINISGPSHYITVKDSSSGHALCLLECGQKEYYYDDNEGIILFPWRKFFSLYNSFIENMKVSPSIIQVIFTSLFQILDKKTGTVLLQTRTYPFIVEKKYTSESPNKITWHTTITDFKDPVHIEFPDEVRNKFHNTVIKNYEVKFENDDNIFTFFFTPKDTLFTLTSFMSIVNSNTEYKKSTYNVNTGAILGSRLKKLNTNFEKAIYMEDKNTIKKIITEKYLNKDSVLTWNSTTGKVLVPDKIRAPNLPQRDREGNTVVHLAVNLKDMDFLKWLVENTEVDINRKNNDGATPLVLAILSKQYDIVWYLLTHKADFKINYKDLYPIDMLIGENNLTNSPESLAVIEYLMLSTSHIFAIKRNLYYTFIQENIPLFDIFFNYGLNNNEKIKLRDFDHPSYLTENALSSGHINLFKYFLSKGINTEQKQRLLEVYYSKLKDNNLLDLVEQAPFTQDGGQFVQTRKNRRTKIRNIRKRSKRSKTRKSKL